MSQDEQMVPNFWDEWYADSNFTTDWSSRAFPAWDKYLAYLRGKHLDILEIGCWEGRGTIFFLNYFTNSKVAAIDLFMFGNNDIFDRNIMSKYRNRVRKIASRSFGALDKLATKEKRAFDLIYLDGSHDTDDVMIDTILAWRLLKVGGVMIWDDYMLRDAMPESFNEFQDPQPAIDTFLNWKKDEYELLDRGYQILVRKTKQHYEMPYTLMDPSMDDRGTHGI